MNSAGDTQAVAGTVPAGEGLDGDDRTGADVDERLVVDDDLVLGHGEVQQRARGRGA